MTDTVSADRSEPIWIALDFPGAVEAEQFLKRWPSDARPALKVGMQLFYAAGPRWVSQLVEAGYPVFLDLKLHDIPNTVAGAVGSLLGLGVRFTTLHTAGGRAMMEAAREAADRVPAENRPRLLAVTQLTSTDQACMNEEIGIPGTVRDSVIKLAGLAYRSGMDGVVCSGEEAGWIKTEVSGDLVTMVPGIRLKGDDAGDQRRVLTPQQAWQSGADHLVVGRSITRAEDPYAVYQLIREQRHKQGREG
ncbi:orotidine-5'-phosphate decarboxylase [Desmospora profundinema]|uniref:Orotidine 5'-phosphate decarboxylase n=1 Tax=Desmospora profundinema TaxID=1571184 RepID=A0ABU1IK47_9BACL|nr:orotidine-5'-phosphate decarboxylase [Desmospora profundinema]MDR6224763.1 orotidine-5'-phosphate decarboxylase [Desmospora profundinema]